MTPRYTATYICYYQLGKLLVPQGNLKELLHPLTLSIYCQDDVILYYVGYIYYTYMYTIEMSNIIKSA